MSDVHTIKIIEWAFGLFIGLVGFIGQMFRSRLAKIEERVDHLDRCATEMQVHIAELPKKSDLEGMENRILSTVSERLEYSNIKRTPWKGSKTGLGFVGEYDEDED